MIGVHEGTSIQSTYPVLVDHIDDGAELALIRTVGNEGNTPDLNVPVERLQEEKESNLTTTRRKSGRSDESKRMIIPEGHKHQQTPSFRTQAMKFDTHDTFDKGSNETNQRSISMVFNSFMNSDITIFLLCLVCYFKRSKGIKF